MDPRNKIIKSLQKASGIKDPHLEFSARSEFGDYTTNIALSSKNPRAKAEDILFKLNKDKNLKEIVEKIDIAGPGFINFHLSTKAMLTNLSQVLDQKENYGRSTVKKGKKVIVEYSSPNIAKPFTIGHMRSTIIGDAIANLMEATGFKVYRDNHLGDWGTQFGKQIYAIKTWGNEKDIEKSENPVKELVALYIKFHEEADKDPKIEEEGRKWFKKLEDGDKEARDLWQKCIDWSWKEFNSIYQKLGIKFTENDGKGYGESYFEGKMQVVLKELEKNKLLKVGENRAKLIFFEKDKYPPLMILKGDGATLYATRDLATDKWRQEKYSPDLIINEVGIEQSLYFKQLFEVEKLLGWYKEGQRIHIGHGHFRFKEGKMSTRKGNVIWLEDVLSEARNRATELQKIDFTKSLKELKENSGNSVVNLKPDSAGKIVKERVAVFDTIDQVAFGALKYNDLKRDYKQDILFDWDEVLNMQGNSGPYLQYTFARIQSLLAKRTKLNPNLNTEKLNQEELLVLRDLIKFPEVIQHSAINYSPNILCEYLFNLAQKYNTLYNKVIIIGSNNEEFLLSLSFSTGQVLKNGLTLLGIATPEKM